MIEIRFKFPKIPHFFKHNLTYPPNLNVLIQQKKWMIHLNFAMLFYK